MSRHYMDTYGPCWDKEGAEYVNCMAVNGYASWKKEPLDMYPPHEPFRAKMKFGLPSEEVVRTFSTGATRDLDTDKHDPEGFLSPLALDAFNTYMHFNRYTAAGMRDSDNWQKGIPLTAYMKSGFRHFIEWWRGHRKLETKSTVLWALLALMFNVQGYIHELLKENPELLAEALAKAEGTRVTPPLQQKVGFIQERVESDSVRQHVCEVVGC